MKHRSIRLLLALFAHFDLELEQLDVKTSFLHGDLEGIFMTQPDGFTTCNPKTDVCLLRKSSYGLK